MQKGLKKINGWNWSAFLLPLIWGIYHRVWISLLALVPGVNIVIATYLGFRGNKLAWHRNCYLSVEEFNHSQRRWLKWSLVIYAFSLIFLTIFLLAIAYDTHLSEEINLRDTQRIADTRMIISAVNNYKLDHDQSCPEQLELLIPIYLEKIPQGPSGESYSYSAEGKECVVSVRLENTLNINFEGDANPDNGNIFDQKSQDLNNYQFYEE